MRRRPRCRRPSTTPAARGADCNSIHENGGRYNPNTVAAHCSWAANSNYQNNKAKGATCDFTGTATLTTSDPSSSGCSYPTSASIAFLIRRCWNDDPDHWRHNGRYPRNLHARCRHHRHRHANRHYYWNHWRWARSRTGRHRHGHYSGNLAPKRWGGRHPHRAPLRHRIRMMFD
uniref:X8 domain-containing protein n=1 Tax=Setaria viridis TaxID=4556 RepID=A0A4U6W036_SETVI|nr:hypothetical protein SEVIR_2G393800v2 [Setaria viridis]